MLEFPDCLLKQSQIYARIILAEFSRSTLSYKVLGEIICNSSVGSWKFDPTPHKKKHVKMKKLTEHDQIIKNYTFRSKFRAIFQENLNRNLNSDFLY